MGKPYIKTTLRLIAFVGALFISEVLNAQNSVSIGTDQINSNAVLWLQGDGSQGFILPIVNGTGSISGPETGMVVYDQSTNTVQYHNGTSWVGVGSGSSGGTYGLTYSNGVLTLVDGGSASQITVSLLGDVSGDADATTVTALQGRSVSSTLPTDTQVLAWSNANNQWEPTTVGAVTGDNWGTDVVNTDGTLTGDGTSGNPLGVNSISTSQISDISAAGSGSIITNAERTKLNNISGTNTGDEVIFNATTDGIVPAPGASTGRILQDDGTWVTPSGGGDLISTNNLSDVANVATSRTNLGLGTLATQNATVSTDGTLAGNSNSNIPTEQAVKTYVDTEIGLIPAGGDLISTNNLSDVTNVTTSRSNLGLGTLATQNATVSTDGTLAGNSNSNIPTEQAVKTYVDTEIGLIPAGGDLISTNNLSDVANVATSRTNLGLGTLATQNATVSTDGTLAGNSNSNIPSEQAVKTYVDTQVSGVSIVEVDGDITNEIQNLTLSSNTLSLSGSTPPSVDLSGYLDNTDAQNLGLTGATGSATTGEVFSLNVSGGTGVTITEGTNIAITRSGTNLTIGSTAAASGEANTASNQGSGGVGVFKQKTSADLEFKNINTSSTAITITDDTGNDEIDIGLNQSQINIPTTQVSGLGTIATQAASSVNITGGTIDGVLLTNASIDNTVSGDGSSLTNINAVQIQGTDVASLSPNTDDVLKWNGTNWTASPDVTSGSPTTFGGAGVPGVVPDPVTETGRYLSDDGTWTTPPGGGDLLSSNNLSDLSDPATARTNLGLGTIATQEASTVNITGGTLDNVTITNGTFSGDGSGLTGITATVTADNATITGNGSGGSPLTVGTIGSGNITDGSVTSADIANGTITNIDIAAGAAIAITKIAGIVDNDATNEIQNLSDVLSQGNSAGTMTITNLADPTNPQDAATMAYVDANSGGATDLSGLSDANVDTGIADAQILIYDGITDNQFENVDIGGDILINNMGQTSIQDDAVQLDDIQDNGTGQRALLANTSAGNVIWLEPVNDSQVLGTNGAGDLTFIDQADFDTNLQEAYDNNGTTADILLSSGKDLTFASSGAGEIFALDEANEFVGIGTHTPNAKLDVRGSGANSMRLLSGAAGNNTSFGLGRTASDLELATVAVAGQYSASSGIGDVVVRQNSTGTERLILQTGTEGDLIIRNNNIGIKQFNPTVSLDINGTDAIRIPIGTTAERPSSPFAGMIRYNSTDGQYEGHDGSIWSALGSGGSSSLQSAYDGGSTVILDGSNEISISSSAGTTLLSTDDANQRVGFGTSSPTYFADFVAPDFGTTNNVMRLTSLNTNTHVDLLGSATGSGAFRIRSNGGANDLVFQTGGNNDRLTIDGSGNVGIGVSSPLSKFQVENTLSMFYDENQGQDFITHNAYEQAAGDVRYIQTNGASAIAMQPERIGFFTFPSGTANTGISGFSTRMNLTDDGLVINGDNLDASSVFDVNSTSKGVLLPRMTTTQRNAIVSPATGLMIYNITTNGFNYYDGSSWTAVGGSSLPTGTSNQTLRHDGTSWVSSSLLQNDGNRISILNTPTTTAKGDLHMENANPVVIKLANTSGSNAMALFSDNSGPNYKSGISYSQDFVIASKTYSSIGTLSAPTASTSFFIEGSNGNVGIGTITPASKLDVEGGLTVGQTYSGTTAAPSNGAIIQGNVGIGTSTPATSLHVYGSDILVGSGGGGAELQLATLALSNQGLNTSGTKGYRMFTYGDSYGTATLANDFRLAFTNSTGHTPIFNIDITGKVGIGMPNLGGDPVNTVDVSGDMVIGSNYAGNNSAPTNGLMVEGNMTVGTSGTSTDYNFYSYSTTAERFALISQSNYTGTGQHYGLFSYMQGAGSGTAHGLYLSNGSTTSGTEYGVYSVGEDYNYFEGSLGIGETTPLSQLHVQETGTNYIARFNGGTASGADGIIVRTGPATPTSGTYFILFQDGVNGFADGSVQATGSGGVSFNTTSDRRLKQNITDIQNALSTVMQIRPRDYEFIVNPLQRETGFIAQELMEIYPQAVSGDPNGDVQNEPMMVDYSKLTPLLTGAIQEQQEIIETQKAEINALKAELAKIKGNEASTQSQLDTMKAQIDKLTQILTAEANKK